MRTINEQNRILAKCYSFLFALALIFYPYSTVYADPWYEKPFSWAIRWFFELFLSPFVGLHEPAYHVFYSGEGKYWGLYTEEEFNVAIQGGYEMMMFVVGFVMVGSIMKSGVTSTYANFSSSMKTDLTELGLKSVFGIVILFNFIPLVNAFFTLNFAAIDWFEAGIQNPQSLKDLGASILASNDGQNAGEKIEFTDLTGEDSGWQKDAIVSFFSLGVAVWFKAFYIQREVMISGLILLAPIWLSTLFFPKMQGMASFGFKELWSQIMGQTVHAGMFWIYFWIMGDQDWLGYLIAIAIFIPVSESLRFAFGATSESSSKLSMVGTAAGLGTIMHGARAVKGIKNGTMNGYKEKKGHNDKEKSKEYGGSTQSASSSNGGGGGTGSTGTSSARTPNSYARKMRTAGHMASGIGSGMGRMAGNFAGMGISPFAQHFMAEGGAEAGEGAGFASGALGYGGGSAVANKTKNAYNASKEGFEENPMKFGGQGGKSFGPNMKSLAQNMGKGAKEFAVSSEFRNDASSRKETMQKAFGTMGAASYGPEMGYQMGADFAGERLSKGHKKPNISDFNDNDNLATVTTNEGSYLAMQDSEGQYQRISNYGSGDPNLQDGEKVMQDHKVSTDKSGHRQMTATSDNYQLDSNGNKFRHQGPSADVNQFINNRPEDKVNTRRRNT